MYQDLTIAQVIDRITAYGMTPQDYVDAKERNDGDYTLWDFLRELDEEYRDIKGWENII